MTREEVKKLSGISSKAEENETAAAAVPPTPPAPAGFPAPASAPSKADSAPPMLPPDIPVFYLAGSGAGQGVAYQPAVIGGLRVHYTSSKYQISLTRPLWVTACLEEGPVPLDWDQAEAITLDPADLMPSPLAGCRFESLPQQALKPAAFRTWQKELLKWARQSHPLEIYRSDRLKMVSEPGESEAGFRARLTQTAREQRDLETENLRKKYASKFTTLQNRELSMRLAMEREADQVKSQKVQTVISFGTAILGAFLGRKMISGQSARGMGSAMKSARMVNR